MQYAFFSIPARGDAAATAEFNRFLSSHRVVQVDRQLVVAGEQSFWSLCIAYTADAGLSGATPTRLGKIDYKEVLSPSDFAIYSRLRELRKAIASEEVLPPYSVFNNEQLAAMVTQRVLTKTALVAIEGVGPARVERYGERFLTVMRAWMESHGERPSAPAEGRADAPKF